VRAYPCRAVNGLIFVFPGDVTLAKERPLPALSSAANKAYKTRRFGRKVKCHYSFMHENLMDMNHSFLHRRQMGYTAAGGTAGATNDFSQKPTAIRSSLTRQNRNRIHHG
jgi:renierapurpurin 18,18'-hydroxylase